MAKIFLSHSSLDKPLARRLAEDLRKAGHSVWLDEVEIHVGHSIASKIQEGLEWADFIAVLLTRNSIVSGWVEREWQSRIHREIQRRSVEILPLKADDCEVPALLRDKKYADLSNYEAGLAEVLRALDHHKPSLDDPQSHQNAWNGSSGSLSQSHDASALPSTGWRNRNVRLVVIAAVCIAALVFWIFPYASLFSKLSGAAGRTYTKTLIEDAMNDVRETRDRKSRRSDSGDGGPTVHFQDWGVNGVALQISGTRYDTQFSYSTDGKTFTRYDPAKTIVPGKDSTFILEVQNSEGTQRFDRSAQLSAAIDEAIAEAKEKQLTEGNEWGCDAYGCKFLEYSQHPVMCSAFVNEIQFGGAAGTSTDKRSLANCDSKGQLCIAGNTLSFPVRPGHNVLAELVLLNGRKVPLEIPVKLANKFRSSELTPETLTQEWMELKPIAERNPQGPAPYAGARYVPPGVVVGSYNIIFGIDPCDSQQQRILADTDGRGLIEAGPHMGHPLSVYFSPGQGNTRIGDQKVTLGPDTKAIALAVDPGNGKIIGPYWYRFDGAEIAARAGVQEEPRVECPTSTNYTTYTWHVCVAANPVAWTRVRSVKFGSEMGALSKEIKIDFNPEQYLRSDCRVDKKSCPPFIFEIPRGWTDVFSAIVLADGTSQNVVRHVLPARN